MSTFGIVPTRIEPIVLSSSIMPIEIKFTWDNEDQCYVHHNEEFLAGEIFYITQSTSCPSLWHFDWLLLDCDCDACLVADGEPTRLDTAHRGSIPEIVLDHFVSRLRETVALNDPSINFKVTLTIEN